MILTDTNILLRAAQPAHGHHRAVLDSIALLTTRDQEKFAVAPQNLYQMYVVCTRPVPGNGLGMTAAQALDELGKVRALFTVLPDVAQAYLSWEQLVTRHSVLGKGAHDARLVSFMLDHGISKLLTLNGRDFVRYSEIQVLEPFTLLGIANVPQA